MEESEKRRERLKRMCREAAEVGASDWQGSIAELGSVSNPLVDSFATPIVPKSMHAERFNYYTDPMSAFSGSKKTYDDGTQNQQGYFSITSSSPMGHCASISSASSVPGSRNSDSRPGPLQFQMSYYPDQSLNETPLPRPMSSSWRSPTGIQSTFSSPQSTPAGVLGARSKYTGSPGYGRGGFHSSGYGRGSSPRTNSGRGNYVRHTNSPSPGLGRGGGRGRGFHANVSAREQPGQFYKKSMVEDAWRFLIPVVRNLPPTLKKTPNSPNSWLPESIRMKRAKVEEGTVDLSCDSSLADCLALAFQEAVEDAAEA